MLHVIFNVETSVVYCWVNIDCYKHHLRNINVQDTNPTKHQIAWLQTQYSQNLLSCNHCVVLDLIFWAQSYIVILMLVVHGSVLADIEWSSSAATLAEDNDATDSQEGECADQHAQYEQTNSNTNYNTSGGTRLIERDWYRSWGSTHAKVNRLRHVAGTEITL